MNIKFINELVNASKLNKVQLAERCNVSRTTLDNLLSGADVKVSTVESLAKALGVNAGKLFDENTEHLSAKEFLQPMVGTSVEEQSVPPPAPITNERLLSIIESQQRTIENLSKR